MPDAQVCGIVQYSLRRLPWIQRRIATGNIDRIDSHGRVPRRVTRWCRKVLEAVVHRVLWCAHGCPQGLDFTTTFTVNDLAERCRQQGWPFLCADRSADESIAEFASRQRPDLVVVLGQPFLSQDLLNAPRFGLTRTVVGGTRDPATAPRHEPTELKLEHLPRGSRIACTLASLRLPTQGYDGVFGLTLKSDLIADDLLLQAAKGLKKGSRADASSAVKEWMQRVLSPYLDQFEPASDHPAPRQARSPGQRHRSLWKLFLQSLVLFPWAAARNWYRRVCGQYPVLVLAHHLVSDRPHRMGMSTEDFWRRLLFLQRHYRIVGLGEAGRLLRSGSVNVPTVVLTMDDGYCDNFITLRAVAEETAAPIVLFVATRLVELHQEFDHDLAAGTKGFFPLTWDQIRYWRGVELGSHTRTHFDCGSCDLARLEPEIAGSREDLEMRLGRRVGFFAFPFGKRENISLEARHMAATTYSIVLSSFGGENLPGEGDRQHLLRKGFYTDPWELELELQSVFDVVQNGRSKLMRRRNGVHPEPVAAKA